jgi:hypothetical protein
VSAVSVKEVMMQKLKDGLARLKEADDLCKTPSADGLLTLEEILKKVTEAIGLIRGYESNEQGAEQPQEQPPQEQAEETSLDQVLDEYETFQDELSRSVVQQPQGRGGKVSKGDLTFTNINGVQKVILAVVNKTIDKIGDMQEKTA